MTIFVHYHKTTGRISAWGDGDTAFLPDHAVLKLDSVVIDPRRQRIADGKLVDVDDLAAWNMPIEESTLAYRIEAELAATDQFMMPDRDVPNRGAWVKYRQALRDLSKQGGVAAAWPTRPEIKR